MAFDVCTESVCALRKRKSALPEHQRIGGADISSVDGKPSAVCKVRHGKNGRAVIYGFPKAEPSGSFLEFSVVNIIAVRKHGFGFCFVLCVLEFQKFYGYGRNENIIRGADVSHIEFKPSVRVRFHVHGEFIAIGFSGFRKFRFSVRHIADIIQIRGGDAHEHCPFACRPCIKGYFVNTAFLNWYARLDKLHTVIHITRLLHRNVKLTAGNRGLRISAVCC